MEQSTADKRKLYSHRPWVPIDRAVIDLQILANAFVKAYIEWVSTHWEFGGEASQKED